MVVAGAQGKKSIISMIAYALEKQKLKFDYALTSEISVLANRVRMSYESRIALIEGDAQVTSELEKRVQLEFYRPHIALLTNLSWSITTGTATPEEYYRIYKSFTASIEREGKLVYFTGDPLVARLAGGGTGRCNCYSLRRTCSRGKREVYLSSNPLRGISCSYPGCLFSA